MKWAEKILSRARQGGVAIPNAEERQKILQAGSTPAITASAGSSPTSTTVAANSAKNDNPATTA